VPRPRRLGLTPVLFGLTIVGLVALVVLSTLGTGLPHAVDGWRLFVVVAGSYGLVGAVAASRRPRNLIGWLP